jgi:hypothetical protein
MPTLLFIVDDVFDISGRYIIPTPGVPVSVSGIRNGLPIELRRPDGTVLQTVVASVPMLDPYDPKRPTQIALQGITKQDVPVGTEIWMRDETPVG